MSPGAAGQVRKTKVKKCAIKHVKKNKKQQKQVDPSGLKKKPST